MPTTMPCVVEGSVLYNCGEGFDMLTAMPCVVKGSFLHNCVVSRRFSWLHLLSDFEESPSAAFVFGGYFRELSGDGMGVRVPRSCV